MERKYELTDETLKWYSHTLHRIRALKDFGDVKKGDLGGWIKSERNLSHEGDCWVYDEAKVTDSAYIDGNAKIMGEAEIYGYVYINCEAIVKDHAKIFDNVEILNNVIVNGYSYISGSMTLLLDITVDIGPDIDVFGDLRAKFIIDGNFILTGNITIKEVSDYIVFKNTWSNGRYFVYTPENKMWTTSNFYGTSDELIKKAYEDSELSGKMYEMYVNMVKSIEKIK